MTARVRHPFFLLYSHDVSRAARPLHAAHIPAPLLVPERYESVRYESPSPPCAAGFDSDEGWGEEGVDEGVGSSRPGGRRAMEVRVGGPRAFVWSVPLVFGGFFDPFELAVAV